MALTNDDKQWIKEAIVEGVNGALETIVLPRFDAVEADISELKRDVSGLKEDVSSLKSDMHEVKSRLDSVESDIREVKDRLNGVESEMREVKNRLGRVEGELQALTNDIEEIYDVIYGKPNKTLMSASFSKMSSKEKLLVINEELLKIAKDTGVVLPR
ncbi:hypothetical protein HG426_003045 [Candidatus Saccharibacteria bacterium]|mgnify:FL=1|nr:hypothetical protein [Candidatus Saccharibacteria bacterium]